MKFWDFVPSEKMTILMNDFQDFGTGGTLTIPWNLISVGIEPFYYTFDTMPANERFQWLMNHELTHTVMTDKSNSRDRFYRSLFQGKIIPDSKYPLSLICTYLTTPRWYCPRWYHEGIAVFMETWMSGGIGRALGGYDEMVFRARQVDQAPLYPIIGLETEGTTIDFQVGVNSYLYGTRFVSYLVYQYGIERLINFYNRTDSSSRFYASQFQKIYQKSVKNVWDDWILWEKNFQEENINIIKKFPVTDFKSTFDQSMGSVSRAFYDETLNSFIMAVNYPGKGAHIQLIQRESGKLKMIAPLESPMLYSLASLAYDQKNKILFVTENNNDWRSLYKIDIQTGKRKQVMDYTRTGELVFNPSDCSLWGIQAMSGRISVVRFPHPYDKIERIYSIPFGISLFDLDISSDGKYLSATLSHPSGKQELVLYEISQLLKGNFQHEFIYEFEDNSAMNFTFSKDGNFLIGSSYYTGVSNIYRIHIETKKMEILTNSLTGLFRPFEIEKDTIFAFQYNSQGFQPGILITKPLNDVNAITYLGQKVFEKEPSLKDWKLPPAGEIVIQEDSLTDRPYSPFKELSFAGLYPIIEGYKNTVSWGLHFDFQDYIMLHNLDLTLGYSPIQTLPQKERFHLGVEYYYWNWHCNFYYNRSDFYDLFGPTKISRAGYSANLFYSDYLFNRKPRILSYEFGGGIHGDLETLPNYQNVSINTKTIYTSYAQMKYEKFRKSLGAIEDEFGHSWSLNFHSYYADEQFYPLFSTSFDKGFLAFGRNSSIWMRTSFGRSLSDKENPFAYFFFGGFGNNYIDRLSVSRYREMESFPGIDINSASAKKFGKFLLEYNLPPIRLNNIGFLYSYFRYVRFSLFVGVLNNNLKLENRSFYYNTGLQADIELVFFSLMKTTLSAGFARAYSSFDKPSQEWMISLKIM